jgi:serine/threonine-protein kinase
MAIVYKAEDAILGRCVALKTLHPRYAEEVSFRLRFKQEARVMASLDHENIVKVYDISQEGEAPFIVAEYIGGQDVGSMLKNATGGRLNEQFTRRVAEQLLGAIDYAHRRGVIHRDVKPSNILITEQGTVKVADFGIARLVEEEEAGKPGEIIGSARYMSPEQLKGEETTPRSDLYSVGILLYHCLTGRPPFLGEIKSVARQQIHKDPTPPRKLNRAISLHMQAVILKALAKNPENRYPSASAMLKDLQRETSTKGAGSTDVGGWSRKRRTHKRRKEHKSLLVPAALALLILLGGGTAVAGLRYANLGDLALPWQAEEAALAPAVPSAVEALPRASEALQEEPEEQITEESLQEESPASSEDEDETPEDLQAAALAPVPDVDAYFDYFALQTLENSGFQPKVVYGYREGYATNGVAWGTDPAVGTLLPLGSDITVYVTPKNQAQQPQIQPPPIQPQPQVQPQVQPQPQIQTPPPVQQPQMQPLPLQPQPQVQPPPIQQSPLVQTQIRG